MSRLSAQRTAPGPPCGGGSARVSKRRNPAAAMAPGVATPALRLTTPLRAGPPASRIIFTIKGPASPTPRRLRADHARARRRWADADVRSPPASRMRRADQPHLLSTQWIRVDGGTETDIASANSSTYDLVGRPGARPSKVKVSSTDDSHAETLSADFDGDGDRSARPPSPRARPCLVTIGQNATGGTAATGAYVDIQRQRCREP